MKSDKQLLREGSYRQALGDNYVDKAYTCEIALEGFDALVKHKKVLGELRTKWVKENDPTFEGNYGSIHFKIPEFKALKKTAQKIAPLTILYKRGYTYKQVYNWSQEVVNKHPNAYVMMSNLNAEWL